MDILESGPKPDFLAGITDAPVLKECASQTRRILNIQACNIVIDSKFQSCVYIYIHTYIRKYKQHKQIFKIRGNQLHVAGALRELDADRHD